MSLIMKEIKQSMVALNATTESKAQARFLFPTGFIGFKGHFPQRPILPGICMVQASIVIAQELHKRDINLKKVILVKFLEAVTKDEELCFEYSEHIIKNNESLLKVSITKSEKNVAKLELVISF